MPLPDVQRSRLAARLLVGAFMVIGAALRILYADREPMWRDEAQTVALARAGSVSELIELLRRDGNSPIFYLAERLVVADRGASHRELRDRSLSVAAGTLMILLAFIAGRAAGRGATAAGLAAAALVALSPVLIDLSSQVRPYAAVALITTLMIIGAAHDDRGRWLYAAAGVAGFYLHALFATTLAAFALAYMPHAIATRKIREWIAVHAAMVACILPGLFFLRHQVNAGSPGGRVPWGSTPTLRDLWQQLVVALTGTEWTPYRYVFFAAVALILVITMPRQGAVRRLVAVTLLQLVISFLLAQRSGTFLTRYHVAAHTTAFVALAAAAAVIAEAGGRWVGKTALAVFVGIWASANALTAPRLPRSASRAVAEVLIEHAGPQDFVVIVPDTIAISVNYYLPPGIPQIDPPSLQRLEWVDFEGWKPRHTATETVAGVESAIGDAARAKRRLWLVVWKRLFGPLPALTPADAKKSALPAQWDLSRQVMTTVGRHYEMRHAEEKDAALEPMVVIELEPR